MVVRYNSRFALVVIVVGIGVAATLIALSLPLFGIGTGYSSNPSSRFDNETLFRSAAPFGHKLAIVPSYFGNEASIGVGNPSGYEFKDCTVTMETVTGEIITNTTLKTYDEILPHSYYYFTAQLEEGYNTDNVPDWLILECKEPYELATSPGIFIGKLDYMPGETVTVKGMLGYSQVTLHIQDGEGNILESKLTTDNGYLQFNFVIPEDAEPGMWSVRVESFDFILGQDFRVVEKT